MMSNFIKYLGGRKSAMFTLTLIVVLILAIFNKATSSSLGLIDTLYLVYAGSNVATKLKAKKELEDKLIERHSKYQFKKDQLKTEIFAKTALTEELNTL